MSTSVYDIPVHRITGEGTSLSDYRGKVLLIVNVASKCGLTKQYEALEQLYHRFQDSGFVILGFPANNFAGQEPGSNEEIATFCSTNFNVSFPLFQKISVTGSDIHPLYQALIAAQPETFAHQPGVFRTMLEGYAPTNPAPGVLWNFEKFLLDRNGNVAGRFSPDVTPDDPTLVAAIEAALKS